MIVSLVLCLIGPQDTRHSSWSTIPHVQYFWKFLKPIFSNLISQFDRHAIKIFEYLKEHIVLFTKKKTLKRYCEELNSSNNNDFLMSNGQYNLHLIYWADITEIDKPNIMQLY